MSQALGGRQERFVAEYLANGLNATQAAIAAGYSPKGAEVRGSELLRNRKVAEAIEMHTAKVMGELDFSVKRTLKEIARIAFFDPANLFEQDGSLKQLKDIDEDTRAVIAGLEVTELFEGDGEQKHAFGLLKKVKLSSKDSALDKLMRYHSLYRDKLQLTNDAEGKSDAELDARIEELLRLRKPLGG